MKLVTLKKLFASRTARTKLFIIGGTFPREFLLTGICFDPREEGEDLVLTVGPYVVYSFERDRVLFSERTFTGLRLAQGSNMTRRLQTHRRNVAKHRDLGSLQHVEEYFELARSLGRSGGGSTAPRAAP
jgi:hypothetical protein